MTDTIAGEGSTLATPQVPDIDVWAWSQTRDPSLQTMRSVKSAILQHASLREQLDDRLTSLGETPEDPRAAGLGRWLLGEYHQAWPLLQKVEAGDPEVDFAKGECCLRGRVAANKQRPMRRPDMAAEMFAKHPGFKTDTVVYSNWLQALASDFKMDEVNAGLESCPEAFKQTADFPYFTGRVAEHEGDYETAERNYKAALELDGSHRPSLLRLAYQYDLGGDDEEALECYERLCAMEPLDVHATVNLGVLFEDMGRFREAIGCYRSVLKQYPHHYRARSYLRDAAGSLNMIFDEDIERRNDKRNRLLRIPINDFELSVRARNCLVKMKIDSLGDLVQKTEAELLAYKNFGETSLNEIKVLLESKGLRLGMNLDEDPIPMHPSPPENVVKETPKIELPDGVDPSVLNAILADMELSVRCRKALAQIRTVTVGDLLLHSESELLSLKNFGTTSLNELKARLSELGVGLRP